MRKDVLPHHEDESSHTTDAFHTGHNPYWEYGKVWIALIVLLLATVGASYLPTGEPWSFLIALAIAVAKAVLVILFFMHVKDASRVTWVFCGSSFIWLGIMLALTFGDYLTRAPGERGATTIEGGAPTPPAHIEGTHG
jgi:cytochrome c oxidase subunit 4